MGAISPHLREAKLFLDSGFQYLPVELRFPIPVIRGIRIPWAVVRNPKPKISDLPAKNLLDSRIHCKNLQGFGNRIPLRGASHLSKIWANTFFNKDWTTLKTGYETHFTPWSCYPLTELILSQFRRGSSCILFTKGILNSERQIFGIYISFVT